MKKIAFAAILTAALMAAPSDPVAWKLQTASAAPVKPGARFNVKLLATVQNGWHLYSMKPMAEGPIATRIWIGDGQPFSLAGGVQAPDPQVVQDPTLGMEVELYEGEAQFTLPVKIAAGTAAGAHALVVSASYQSCNDKICLPPKTVKVEIPVTVAR
uniref:Thiol:disulfide interchange protein DsbD N-terminal domain-containing protein n=1 Tax=Solibacter usitatus (strain Ellin6076) TaxID=234267 RepID=Q02CV9_SOLUE